MTAVLPCPSPSSEVGSATLASSPTRPTHVCRPVAGAAELAQHHAVRRAVFVHEQGLFDRDDHDRHDDGPSTVHVLGLVDGVVAGTVRLYPLHPLAGGVWKGDRLAVLPAQRHAGIGGPLVRFAVATAAALGGRRMDALVQAVNTGFFSQLGWAPVGGPVEHLGVPHQAMTIALR